MISAPPRRTAMSFIVAMTFAFLTSQSALAHEFSVGKLRVEHPWARAVAVNSAAAAGYMEIYNIGAEADRLIGATTASAARVEIHEVTMVDHVMRMRPVQGGVEVRAGESVRFGPNGFHLMIIGPNDKFVEGAKVPLTLEFERAGKLDVELAIESARFRAADHSAH